MTATLGADTCVRCHDGLFSIPGVTAVSARSGSPVCSHCADSGRIELRRQPGPSRANWRYAERALEHYRSLLPEERAEMAAAGRVRGQEWDAIVARTDEARARAAGYEDEYRDVDDDDADEHDGWGATGAELRTAFSDGLWAYGPEPSGQPLEGRSYDGRWWVPGFEERAYAPIDRTFEWVAA